MNICVFDFAVSADSDAATLRHASYDVVHRGTSAQCHAAWHVASHATALRHAMSWHDIVSYRIAS